MDPQELIFHHVNALRACNLCANMQRPVVTGRAIVSKVLLVGQAPGEKEPQLQRPFAWTAGKTLFQWFHDACGLSEEDLRSRIYLAAVCRCFPGKKPHGGDRVPDRTEISNCSRWLKAEMDILHPELVIPVGRLAITQFVKYSSLDAIVGRSFRCTYDKHLFDAIPLPHPSGASPWPRVEPGKTLLRKGLALIAEHPEMRNIQR